MLVVARGKTNGYTELKTFLSNTSSLDLMIEFSRNKSMYENVPQNHMKISVIPVSEAAERMFGI